MTSGSRPARSPFTKSMIAAETVGVVPVSTTMRYRWVVRTKVSTSSREKKTRTRASHPRLGTSTTSVESADCDSLILFATPGGRPLGEEGAHALLRVGGERVHAHDLFSVV